MKHKPAFTLALALAGVSAFALAAQAQSNGVGVGASIDVEEVSSKVVFSGTVVNGLPSPLFRLHPAKFVCGQVPADKNHPEKPDGEFAFEQHALTPGTYLTAINIFNPNLQTVEVEKFLSLAAAERVGDDGPVSAGDMDDGEFVGVVLEGANRSRSTASPSPPSCSTTSPTGRTRTPWTSTCSRGSLFPLSNADR